ncbi:MAG: T9SS type B sorting domain-containing protein [Flavobacteriales bacterium]
MKQLLTYCSLVLLSVLASCSSREQNEALITDDPNFQPETQEYFLSDTLSEIGISTCYFENNDLKLIYSGKFTDSLHWMWKNKNSEFIRISTGMYLKIAQVGSFRLKAFKGPDSIVHNISIYTCPSAIEAVPVSFTPNKDGQFDTWAPIGKGVKTIKFTITSMNNEKLFESTSLDNPWNGEFEGHPVPSGSYRYEVKGTLFNGKAFTYKGILSLSR